MKLFLSGGGSEPYILDEKFMENVDKSKPMLYIPIAIDQKKHPFPECYKRIKKYFSEFNLKNIEMATDLRNLSRKDLDKFGSVYIGGGNTPYLLKELRESEFIKYLQSLMKKDIPLAGGSAGAIIFAKSIIPALSVDENKVGIKDFSALNKINGYELWCHYEPSMDKEIRDYIKKYNLNKILALPEQTGIFADDKIITVYGEKSAFVFDEIEKIEIKSGEKLIWKQ